MADTKITSLQPPQVGYPVVPATDVLPIVVIADPGMATSGSTRKVTVNQLLGAGGTATLASATITGNLTVDTNTLFVDSSANVVGIGSASVSSYGTNLVVQSAGKNAGLVVGDLSTPANATSIYLRTTGVASFYNAVGGSWAWGENGGSTLMTLNSTGLGVGGGPVSSYKFQSTQTVSSYGGWFLAGLFTSPTATMVRLSCSTPDRVSSIANDGDGGFKIITNGTLTTVGSESLVVTPTGNVGIGVAPSAGKGCLQLSSGINFPATQVASSDANTLDDYEEGTFTPTIVGSGTTGTGTYTTQTGRYTKIGNQVTVQIYFFWTAHTGTGDMFVTGLPFTLANVSGLYPGVSFGIIENITLSAGKYLIGYGNLNTTNLILLQYPTGGGPVAGVPIDTSGSFSCTMTYQAA